MVPFESFRSKLKAALIKGELRTSDATRKSLAGRKPWDEVMIFKALVLQALYNLCDDQAEYQLRDRLSFMRFLGLELEDTVPDAKTLWLYREALGKAGAVEELFDLFDGFLKDKGYLAMGGQIIDATIVSAPKQHNRRCSRYEQHGFGRVGRDERPRIERSTSLRTRTPVITP